MAMAPQNWLIQEYSKEWLNNRNYGTSSLDGQLANHHTCSWHMHSMLSFSIIDMICLNRFSCSLTCSSICIILSKLSINSDLFVTSTLAKYPGSIYRCIDQLCRIWKLQKQIFVKTLWGKAAGNAIQIFEKVWNERCPGSCSCLSKSWRHGKITKQNPLSIGQRNINRGEG